MRRKAGFTLIEVMAVLGITALTVSIFYTVGMRGVFEGFRLGNRALATADSEIGKLAYRDLIASMVIPPVAVSAQAAEDELLSMVDDTFVGGPAEVSGYFIAGRNTPCAQAGVSGRLSLTFEADLVKTTVFCSVDDAEPSPLMSVRFPAVGFSYSEDGQVWYDEWYVERGLPVETQYLPNGELRQVLVRLASEDGVSQIIALASSGRAISQTPPAIADGGGGGGGGGGGRGGGGPDGPGGGRGGGRGG